MDNKTKKYTNEILVYGLSFSPFFYMLFTWFMRQLDKSFGWKTETFLGLSDLLLLSVSIFILLNKKITNSFNYDILKGVQFPSYSFIPMTLYSIISFSAAVVVVKEEVLYLSNFMFSDFKFFTTVYYFDFYDKLIWENVSFVNNLSFFSSFLKVWIIGFLLIYNPFFSKDSFFKIDINIKHLFILFSLVIILSFIDSIRVHPTDLIKANYYFFKQSLIFSVMFLCLCNIDDFQHNKKYERVIQNTDLLIFYTIIISLQTLFYKVIYDIYFLEVVLIILAVACRDSFKIKVNCYFSILFSAIILYEFLFYTYCFITVDAFSIDKSLLEKLLAMSISTFIYFYKDHLISLYKKYSPLYPEKEFCNTALTTSFNKKFGTIFDISKILNIDFEDDEYIVNNIKFKLFYETDFENPFLFKFLIIYIKKETDIVNFNGILKNKLLKCKNNYKDGDVIKITGHRDFDGISIDDIVKEKPLQKILKVKLKA